jgi:hypothetical protein
MAMKLVKKTDQYSIFKRGDDRYAVQDAGKNAVNGDEKVRILVEEGLITVAVAAPVEEAPAEEEAQEDSSEEAVAEEAEPEAAAEQPADEEAKD